MASILNATTSSGLVTSADNSGSLQLATNNGTTAVTIDTSQNVGIGTTTPTQKLNVAGFGAFSGANRGVTLGEDNCLILGDSATLNSAQMRFYTANTERMRLDTSGNLLFNSGYGSVATAYGCRAWVNFNGTGTPAIRGSGNVSSITDNGTGNYSVNFATAMPDFNYAVGGLVQPSVSNNGSDTFANLGSSSANAVTIIHYEDGTLRDSSWVSCIVLR